jgi:DNA-binding PadR family transcriptional regulator
MLELHRRKKRYRTTEKGLTYLHIWTDFHKA